MNNKILNNRLLNDCFFIPNFTRHSYNNIGGLMNLVFEGGGIKGLCYIGALRYLEERGFKIANVAGSSVGAIIASLVCAGYKAKELEQIIEEIDFHTIWPKSSKRGLRKTFDIVKKRYIYRIEPLEVLLDKLLLAKGIKTFGDVKVDQHYRLKVIVTNLKTKAIVVVPNDLVHYGINPDFFAISKAVCMSSSIPFVYPPYKVNNYRFVDGGVGDNFPIWLYEDNVLGFRVNKDSKLLNFFQQHFFKNKKPHNHANLIYIDTKDIKTTDFIEGLKMRKILYNRGYYSTKVFFDNYFTKH